LKKCRKNKESKEGVNANAAV